MPVQTKQKPRTTRRTTSYRPRTGHSRRRPRGHRVQFPRLLKSARAPWILISGGVALVLTLLVTAPLLVQGAEWLLENFGLGILLIAAAIVVDGRIAWRRPAMDSRYARIWAGAHLLGVFLFGVLGLWYPTWVLADVSLADVSAGGEIGQSLTEGPIGVLVWLASAVAGVTLVWPRTARGAWAGALATARLVGRANLPRMFADTVSAFVGILVPKDEEEPPAPTDTYVPQWDEEWQEAPESDVDGAEPAIDEMTDEPAVLEEEAPEEEAYQRELPMGKPVGRGWELPPLDLLAEAADVEVRPMDNEARSNLIVETLASFGVDARVVSINQGPTVTQFGVEPGWEVKTRTVPVKDERGRQIIDKEGRPQVRTEVVSKTRVRVNRITTLANDLALALAAPTIRIEAPVPGKPIIGIEVPNTTTSLVSIRSVIESTTFQKTNARTHLAIALGKGVSGEPVATDLARMPHLLIAGATGSGKSVCINSVIASLLLHNTPEELRLVLVDPKRVELAVFGTIPHLAFSKIITDPDETVGTLQAVIHEMDSRYRRFASVGVRNIEAYNKSPRATHRLPYWVVVIDELADLMMAAPYEVERQICRLAQLARATGIHLIVATQRPSVDVVTGLIKANFPTRIAFAVSSQVDSRTIIDGAGAEKLLGRGDMLFMPTDASKPKRIQGSFVSDGEIEKLVAWWSSDRFRHLVPEKLDHLLDESDEEAPPREDAASDDPLFEAAKDLAQQHSRVSTSLLQRRLHIGYPRAARLIDLLEQEGVVGAAESGQSRQVLVADAEEDDFGDRFE
jgi:S-DNA-T family DNA segregation ATPase FtsK/SpoIIIE